MFPGSPIKESFRLRCLIAACGVCSFGMLLIGFQLWGAPSSAQPKITWSLSKIEVTLSPGESTSKNVTFSSNQAIKNVAIEPVPQIAPFVTMQPSTLASMPAGEAQGVRLSFSVPPGATLGEYQGTIHARLGSYTLSQPFKIAINIWPSTSQNGIKVTYPLNWQFRQVPPVLNGPLTLTTLGTAYQQGGILSPHAAEINVTITPLPSTPLDTFISNELQDATIHSSETIMRAGAEARLVSYTDSYTPYVSYGNRVVYAPRGSVLYRFRLSYRSEDPLELQFLGDFQQILT